MAFAARGEQSALYSRFSAAATPEIEFAEGEAALSSVAREILHEQAAWLVAHPDALVTLIAGAGPGDRELAARRARAAEAVLIDHGVLQSRIRLTVAGELATNRPLKMSNLVVTEVSDREDRTGFWLTVFPALASAGVDAPSSAAPEDASTPSTTQNTGDSSEPEAENTPGPTESPISPSGTTPSDQPSTSDDPEATDPPAPNEKPKRPNAGKGNGSEDSDPGNSADNNQAGDE